MEKIFYIYMIMTTNMNEIIFTVILIIILSLYFVLLYKKTSRGQDNKVIGRAFAVIFILGLILHVIIYSKIAFIKGTPYDFLTLAYYSILHSLKMFMGGITIYRIMGDLKEMPLLCNMLVTTFYMALLTSGFFIFNFISRTLYTRRWLGKKKNVRQAAKGGNSIFLGVNRYATILAADIRHEMTSAGKDGMILFIELPDKNEKIARLSIWDILRQFLKSNHKVEDDVVCDIRLKIKDNMKGLLPWLENPENDVYILSDDIARNIAIAEKILENPALRCHIYCHARKEGLIAKYDNIADLKDQLTIIDSSFLAVEGLKRNADLHPVNFVEVGTENGLRAGWVSDKGFTSAILGFGETGKESLSFLYEFGAFPNKDMHKAPFKCYVFDNDMERASSDFLRKVPGVNRKEIEFVSQGINTPGYWEKLSEIIDSLNYVIVSLGNDMTTLNTAIDLAEFALRYRRSDTPDDNLKNFVILCRLCDPERMDKLTLESANHIFGGCIKPFGQINDIWNYDIISNHSINILAEKFYNSYETLANGVISLTWREKLESRSEGTYRDRCKAQRQVAQNYSDFLHTETKKRICDAHYHQYAQYIVSPSAFDGIRHYIGEDKDAGKVMEYLAVGEKLRWNASHEILGYVKGSETDDQIKTHKYLGTYEELDPQIRHYDWLVVRNSLI